MYEIMIARSIRDDFESLYQFMTTSTNGVAYPLEIDTKEKLDKKIQHMLNCEGYSKEDFIVIKEVDYYIDATRYSDGDGSDNGGNGNGGTGNTGGTGGTGSGGEYTLPVATATTLGGVMIGDKLDITSNGVLSVDDTVIVDTDLCNEDEVKEDIENIFSSK